MRGVGCSVLVDGLALKNVMLPISVNMFYDATRAGQLNRTTLRMHDVTFRNVRASHHRVPVKAVCDDVRPALLLLTEIVLCESGLGR